MKEIKGYLIQDQEGNYLSHHYFWFPHDCSENAWVHPGDKLKKILTDLKSWAFKPARVIKVTYSPERGTPLLKNQERYQEEE